MIQSNDGTRELREVTLSFSADPGAKVSVVGSFNGWDHEKTPAVKILSQHRCAGSECRII
ncbi:MAG: hypothetical protein AAF488_05165 [Planctomycetota bacterium]